MSALSPAGTMAPRVSDPRIRTTCQLQGERTTNGNDCDQSDDADPERLESTRYYGVRLGDGTFGSVSEVWIRAADRGGLGLPSC